MTFVGKWHARTVRKQMLGSRPIPGSDRGQSAQQFDIDQGNAHFEGMCHAGPIRVTQQLIAHIERGFQHGDLAKGGPRLRFQQSFDVPNWVEAAQAQPSDLCTDHGLQLPWHEQPAAQEICTRITSAVFKQTCSFWVEQTGRKHPSEDTE